MTILTLNKNNFDQVIATNDFVVVDFWAEWCGPCKDFAKVCEKAAAEHKDVVFASVNIDQEPELAKDFAVRSIPFILILRQSIAVFAESGALTLTALNDLLQQAKQLDMQKIREEIKKQQSEGDAREEG